jgi:hypothetical protein
MHVQYSGSKELHSVSTTDVIQAFNNLRTERQWNYHRRELAMQEEDIQQFAFNSWAAFGSPEARIYADFAISEEDIHTSIYGRQDVDILPFIYQKLGLDPPESRDVSPENQSSPPQIPHRQSTYSRSPGTTTPSNAMHNLRFKDNIFSIPSTISTSCTSSLQTYVQG